MDRAPTILNNGKNRVNDGPALALRALGWILADDARATRFLALTGLTPEALRAGLERAEVQRAALDFLTGHEPDLVAAADALGVAPAELAAAGARILP